VGIGQNGMHFAGKIQLAEASKRASIIALVILGLLQNNIFETIFTMIRSYCSI
jgi:hypothetical protein